MTYDYFKIMPPYKCHGVWFVDALILDMSEKHKSPGPYDVNNFHTLTHCSLVMSIYDTEINHYLFVMSYCLFSAKPLPEPIMTYCWLDPKEQTSVKFE